MDFELSEEQEKWGKSAALFAEEEIRPIRERLEEDVTLRRRLFATLGKKGLLLLTAPSSYGGQGLDALSYVLAVAAIAKMDAGVAVAMTVTNMVAEAIVSFGSEEQKRRYLPPLADGTWVGACFAMTEKHAGSDPRSLECRAVRTTDGYEISGHKQFITNGDLADICLVFARVDGCAEGDGITAFVIEKSQPGWRVETVVRKMGLLTVNLVNLAFDACRVSRAQRLGDEGAGLRIGLNLLDRGRIGIAAQSLGIAEAALGTALDYAKKREQFGKELIKHEAIAFKLADMKMALEATRLLVYRAAWLRMGHQPFTLEASMAKLFASEAANAIASEALQIHGGYGYVKDYPLERYFRDARATTIYEGTSEIQRLVIARCLSDIVRDNL